MLRLVRTSNFRRYQRLSGSLDQTRLKGWGRGFIECVDEQTICSSQRLTETGWIQTKDPVEAKRLLERLGMADVSVGRLVSFTTHWQVAHFWHLTECGVWGLETERLGLSGALQKLCLGTGWTGLDRVMLKYWFGQDCVRHHQPNTEASILAKNTSILVYIRSFGKVGALQRRNLDMLTQWATYGNYGKRKRRPRLETRINTV